MIKGKGKTMMRKGIKKHKGVLCIVILLLLLFVGVSYYRQTHTFSSEVWRNEPEKRTKIVQDLLSTYALVGMSENEITSLLGEEEQVLSQQATFKGDSTYYPPDETFVYFLGKDGMEGRWLILSFQDDRVAKVSFGVT